MWDEPIQDSEHYLQPKLKWRNIQQTDAGFIAYGKRYGKKEYLGTFKTLEEAINAQTTFKFTGEKSLQIKQRPIDQLPDLLAYYFETTPQEIKHSYLDDAHIECGNEIGFLISNPYFNIIEIP